ncbi:glycerate kinase [Microterricola viridarii]|uniref:Glycerate kinase n=1 Tax=Microterricola viridarii TaxID=412690 RepID=A0A0Y0P6K7_9MICO|nr:glycerate kinase [Microterricola viridarii]AMB59814.1 glycerate kinase [Microterricola viridarii]
MTAAPVGPAPLRVVIAPDSFKGTLSAADAARAIAAGWASVRPADELRLLPMADGGEGTLDAFALALPGGIRMPVTVQGPDNESVQAEWLLLPGTPGSPGGTAVVELANTSGITLLDPLRPLDAHTLGFGQAIAAALDHGVHRLLLALGGSSSSDGGAGALTALGAYFTDATGRPVRLGNRGLGQLARVRLETLRALPPGGAQILSDVSNPLLGPLGAAAVFGPQKGASPEQVEGIESGLRRLARLLPGGAELPGAGAAGGTGFGLLHWGATITPGASAVGQAMGVPQAVAAASVVITGEGRFDSQSAAGKVPSYLAGLAADAGIPALLVAGAIEAPTVDFADALSLGEVAGSPGAALAEPDRWLRASGARLARSVTDGHPGVH